MTVYEYPYSDLNDGDVLTDAHHTLVTGYGAYTANPPPVIRVDGGYRYVDFTSTDAARWFNQAFPATNAVSVAFEFEITGTIEGAIEFGHLRNATTKQGNLLASTSRVLTLRNAADANASAAPALATSTKYVCRVGGKKGTGTSDGHYLYSLTRSSDGVVVHSFSSTTQNAGTADFTSVQFGDMAGATDAAWRLGRLRIATGSDAIDGSGNLVPIEPYTAAPDPDQAVVTVGGAWVPATPQVTIGGAWVPISSV